MNAPKLEDHRQADVQRMCTGVLLLPLLWAALLEGKKPRSFLISITGLSKSLIASGGLSTARPSTVERAKQHGLRLAKERALATGWAEPEFASYVERAPKLRSGVDAQLAGLLYAWSRADGIPLKHSIQHAVRFEEFATRISVLDEEGRSALLREAVLTQSTSARSFGSPSLTSPIDAGNSEQVIDPSQSLDQCLMDLYWEFLATLDAEWGGQYFEGLGAPPVFPLVFPSVSCISASVRNERNWLRRPVRRLLEVTYALAVRHYSGNWPSCPIGRTEVGNILEISDSEAGNYFDGTRKLTMKAFETWWIRLSAELRSRFPMRHQLPPPAMLARVALLSQASWIKTDSGRTRSVVLPDVQRYRDQWARAREMEGVTRPSQVGDWPGWLVDQSSFVSS